MKTGRPRRATGKRHRVSAILSTDELVEFEILKLSLGMDNSQTIRYCIERVLMNIKGESK